MLPLMRPLIAICGTTGVGKSKLAIELALALSEQTRRHGGYLGARIINADAMQVYAGLDVLTNKVPLEEQCGVEHLLMGFKQPGEQYVVGQWVKHASRLIDETHERNQIPIVVGGTSYWIQHLVFPERLLATFDDSNEDSDQEQEQTLPSADANIPHEQSQSLLHSISALPPELLDVFNHLPDTCPSAAADPELCLSLHKLLQALDPIVAQRWHWRDTRKVLRSLSIIQQTGRLSSEIIDEQSRNIPQPRYRTLCFWLYAQPEVLNPRLDARVDQMIEQGLLKEVAELQNAARGTEQMPRSKDSSPDFTLGLYQSIGYREFSSYLANQSLADPAEDQKLFREAVERMKLSTRKYAKRQVSWIRNKLLPAAYAANSAQDGQKIVSAYLLDATELGDKWVTNVQSKANLITDHFLETKPLPDPRSLSETAHTMLTIRDKATNPKDVLNARRRVVCPVCTIKEDQPIMIEEGDEWTAHAKTRRHRRLASQAAKRTRSSQHTVDSQRISSDDEKSSADNVEAARNNLFDP
ncbi:hypothetical protein NM688_g6889 [Phlebia brevispora]|uniref:Uncharacterized protein n=1 Tax=Phlebia brevispora TaxID=194682 RepID=A0ACC1SBL9_9APHY|nr:hypothetical protein NM688_g6889 [Phlebia brevispora]